MCQCHLKHVEEATLAWGGSATTLIPARDGVVWASSDSSHLTPVSLLPCLSFPRDCSMFPCVPFMPPASSLSPRVGAASPPHRRGRRRPRPPHTLALPSQAAMPTPSLALLAQHVALDVEHFLPVLEEEP
ncbi:hypothetical protein KC19_VG273000 [Ceratodon purpureus]|uniref:Uncharacterized protein n=1 Tax=Ceratodon purpureus TaxID=3225 RepID=A0A8T0HV36_CERPU|nr:hypothetical protein KC19_VG273000 [Ceratodon purpureus]